MLNKLFGESIINKARAIFAMRGVWLTLLGIGWAVWVPLLFASEGDVLFGIVNGALVGGLALFFVLAVTATLEIRRLFFLRSVTEPFFTFLATSVAVTLTFGLWLSTAYIITSLFIMALVDALSLWVVLLYPIFATILASLVSVLVASILINLKRRPKQ